MKTYSPGVGGLQLPYPQSVAPQESWSKSSWSQLALPIPRASRGRGGQFSWPLALIGVAAVNSISNTQVSLSTSSSILSSGRLCFLLGCWPSFESSECTKLSKIWSFLVCAPLPSCFMVKLLTSQLDSPESLSYFRKIGCAREIWGPWKDD